MLARQVQREGALADSMAVSVLLMQLYIFKFFLCAPPSCQSCRLQSVCLQWTSAHNVPACEHRFPLPSQACNGKQGEPACRASPLSFGMRSLLHARWETGYWCTMDIAHDRAGYYLCWGCLVWVPAIYTSPALFLVNHPVRWGPAGAAAIALAGVAAIYINYDSDRQRQARCTKRRSRVGHFAPCSHSLVKHFAR